MSYKSLLFCPDEKNARVVTQVLTELEFHVELCNEPFAAVKKLMAEHFDAVVVDCENEQNATLLFKSARNSGSNQTSLSVAVVEGQSGVAKAFRIGANLVLTKPINVEQSKGTLRVARGLLRKSEAGKPAQGASAPAPDFNQPKAAAPPAQMPAPAFTPAPAPPSIASMSASTSSVFELEKEPEAKPEPTEAALLESMSVPIPGKLSGADAGSKGAKPYPWQPVPKPMAEPMVSALRAAEAATKPSFEPTAKPASQSSFVSSQGAATGVAPAKEHPPVEKASPTFEPLDSAVEKPFSGSAQTGSSGKILAIAAVVLIAAAGGYFGWTKMHKVASSSPKPTAQLAAPAATPAPAPAVTGAIPESTSSAPANIAGTTMVPTPRVTERVASDVAPTSKKSNSSVEMTSTQPAGTTKIAEDTLTSDALMVKGGSAPKIKQPAAPQDDTKAPDVSALGSNANDGAISGLVNAPTNVPSPAPQNLKVSQGVSQGLLVKKVPPIYPAQAMQMRIQGAVELTAHISKDGNITSVKVLSGPSALARAAVDAVKQWKYKPYYLDGEPVEIQTQITVNFKLP